MAENSRSLVTKQAADNFRALLDKAGPSMKAVMPEYLKPDRLLRLALSAVLRDPKILQCDQRTILLAIMNASICGLEPNTPTAEGYLIPRKNKKQGIMEAVFMPSYRGLLKLVRNSGQVASVQAHIVYKNEEFTLDYGANPPIKHIPILDGDPGPVRLVYAVAKMTDPNADPIVQVLTLADIAKIKAMSESAGSEYSPWQKWPDQMMIKSAIRRLSKYLPQSPEMAYAVALEDRAAAGTTQADLVDSEVLEAFQLEAPEGSEEVNQETGEVTAQPEMREGDPGNYRGHGKTEPEPKKGAGF